MAKTLKGADVTKLNAWFAYYTDNNNPETYLNQTASARAAGYKTKSKTVMRAIGAQNFAKLRKKINKWLDETGLSEEALKARLLSLLDVKEVKYQKLKGKVSQTAKSVSKLAETDDETLIAIEQKATETQRRALDMALRVKGAYAPDRHEHTGNVTIELVDFCNEKPETHDKKEDKKG